MISANLIFYQNQIKRCAVHSQIRHQRDNEGLRDCLVEADRKWSVGVGVWLMFDSHESAATLPIAVITRSSSVAF
jgi:hypothetical protein